MILFKKTGFPLILLVLFSGCIPSGKIEVGKIHSSGYRLKGSGKIKAELMVPVSNQTNSQMKIKKIEFILLIDNEEIGKMSGTDKILIKAMSDSTYTFPVIINYEPSVSRGIKTLFRLFRDGSISILVNGKISGCAGIFPFRRKIHQEAILRFKKQTNEF